jgi:nitrite reductase (NADH) small subunit
MKWIQITEAVNVPLREGRAVDLGDRQLALFHLEDRFVAVENKCPHNGGPLADGIVGGADGQVTVTCPLHAWRICLDSGQVTKPCDTAVKPVETYPVRLVDGVIEIGVPGYSNAAAAPTE